VGACGESCPPDINGDASVSAADLSALLAAWGLADSGVGHQAQPPDCHEPCRTPDRMHAGLPRTIPAATASVDYRGHAGERACTRLMYPFVQP